jgi:cyclophilin family peptidyl-prolyl cis-trans isomerase
LSAILGWTPSFEGPTVLSGGQPAAPQAKAGRPGQAPGTMPVQAPPLQVPALTPAPGNPVAVMSTSFGDITIELFKDRAPVSVENFLRYANEGFYNGTIFHRVKPAFMIQGGGYTDTLTEKPTRAPIQNEATNGLRNARGTVAMARLASLRSATSQFYINLVDNRALDHTGYSPSDFGYAVFGRVLSGMDIADRIAAVPTGRSGDMEDVPVEPVVIKSVRVLK